jgi:hypothetical protein
LEPFIKIATGTRCIIVFMMHGALGYIWMIFKKLQVYLSKQSSSWNGFWITIRFNVFYRTNRGD